MHELAYGGSPKEIGYSQVRQSGALEAVQRDRVYDRISKDLSLRNFSYRFSLALCRS
jgi:hypothetical protein